VVDALSLIHPTVKMPQRCAMRLIACVNVGLMDDHQANTCKSMVAKFSRVLNNYLNHL
jgi:hypothetical protein